MSRPAGHCRFIAAVCTVCGREHLAKSKSKLRCDACTAVREQGRIRPGARRRASSRRADIIKGIEAGTTRAGALAAQLRRTPQSIGLMLRFMALDGLVTQTESGAWALVTTKPVPRAGPVLPADSAPMRGRAGAVQRRNEVCPAFSACGAYACRVRWPAWHCADCPRAGEGAGQR